MRKRIIPSLLLLVLAVALYCLPAEYLTHWRLGLYDLYLHAADLTGGRRVPAVLSDTELELRERLLQKDAEIALLRQRLRQVAEFREHAPNLRFVAAQVLCRGEDPLGDSLSLDRGTADGVRVDDGVMQGQALAGMVELAGVKSCRVKLLSNPACLVSAVAVTDRGQLDPAREACTVIGRGRGAARVIFYANRVSAKTGSAILTSGLRGKLPEHLLLGHLAEDPAPGPEPNTLAAAITFAADLRNLEEALVLHRAAAPEPPAAVTRPRRP